MASKTVLSPVIILKSIKNSGPKRSQGLKKKSIEIPVMKTSLFKHKHPTISNMVNSAISSLNEKGGSSLYAIKKYVAGNFHLDSKIQAPFIKKYLRAAVVSGSLIQTSGKGASGSFKMSAVELLPKMEMKRVKSHKKVSGLKRKRLIKSSKKDKKMLKLSKSCNTMRTNTTKNLPKAVKIFGLPNTKLVAPIRIIKTGPKMTFTLMK